MAGHLIRPGQHIMGRPVSQDCDNASKVCEGCGRTFYLREKKFQSLAKFMKRRFCSVECSGQPKYPDDFWHKVDKQAHGGCWEWRGKVSAKGYGQLTANGKEWRAHRYSYFLQHGDVPDDLLIRHGCDNRLCVNPEHLQPGTALDNVADAISRGRMAWQSKGGGTGQ